MSKHDPEREIRSTLHDGTEVVFNTGDRVLFLAARPGGMPLTTDPESLYDDLVLTLEQRDATIESLRRNNQAWQTDLRKERQSSTGMRKVLEEARSYFGDIATYTTDKDASKVASRGFNLVTAALGEGDNH